MRRVSLFYLFVIWISGASVSVTHPLGFSRSARRSLLALWDNENMSSSLRLLKLCVAEADKPAIIAMNFKAPFDRLRFASSDLDLVFCFALKLACANCGWSIADYNYSVRVWELAQKSIRPVDIKLNNTKMMFIMLLKRFPFRIELHRFPFRYEYYRSYGNGW